MPRRAKEIYKKLQNVYGGSLDKAFINNYSSDSQCAQFNTDKFIPMRTGSEKKWDEEMCKYSTDGYLKN